jgi:hypothetical protein
MYTLNKTPSFFMYHHLLMKKKIMVYEGVKQLLRIIVLEIKKN